jgi:hypothetical protein
MRTMPNVPDWSIFDVTQLRERRAEDPAIEETLELDGRFGLHRHPEVVRARLLESPVAIETPNPVEERVVSDQPPHHVQHDRRLVV